MQQENPGKGGHVRPSRSMLMCVELGLDSVAARAPEMARRLREMMREKCIVMKLAKVIYTGWTVGEERVIYKWLGEDLRPW